MKKKSTEQLIFPIIVGVLSLLNVVNLLQEFYLSSLLVSLIGIIGVTLFLLDKKRSGVFFYVWIIAQIIAYSSLSFTYYADQFRYFTLGFSFQSTNSVFAVNFLPLFYFIGYRLLKMYDLIGKQVSIRPIKAGSNLKSIDGEITDVIDRNKDGRWLKVEFIEETSSEVKAVMIKPKGDERFSRKASIFAFVNECGEQTTFIDWGKVKLK